MMNQFGFDDLLEKFLNDSISSDELEVFLTRVKMGRSVDGYFMQKVILEKLESGAYSGLGEQEKWRELYNQTLRRIREGSVRDEVGADDSYMMRLEAEPIKKEVVGVDDKWAIGDKGRVVGLKMWGKVAVLMMVLVGAGIYLFLKPTGWRFKGEEAISDLSKAVGYSRYAVLVDGSRVVLNAGSTLEDVGERRVMRLKGEAYFDVERDEQRPFVIYTGKVKTTVLGTSFNIKAEPGSDEVVVSVTTGRVKVEEEKKERLLGVLTENEQMVYSGTKEEVKKEVVNAKEVVMDWAKKDMVFEEEAFESVVEVIGRRYGVRIEFKNSSLKNCKVKASFSGTEPLKNVLDVLTTISNSKYVEEKSGVFFIMGEGCE